MKKTEQKNDDSDPKNDTWKTIIDFTEVDPKGVPAEKVLEALRSLDKNKK